MRLQINEAIAPLPLMPSWRAKGGLTCTCTYILLLHFAFCRFLSFCIAHCGLWEQISHSIVLCHVPRGWFIMSTNIGRFPLSLYNLHNTHSCCHGMVHELSCSCTSLQNCTYSQSLCTLSAFSWVKCIHFQYFCKGVIKEKKHNATQKNNSQLWKIFK